MLINRKHPDAKRAYVLWDGIDITKQVQEANDEEGWADIFEISTMRKSGPMLIRLEPDANAENGWRVVRRRVTGRIEIGFREKA